MSELYSEFYAEGAPESDGGANILFPWKAVLFNMKSMTWTAKSANLSNLSHTARTAALPESLRKILSLAERLGLRLKRVWIFGSRARGDARSNSDFDLAFEIQDQKNWSQFVLEIHENPPSLHRYDLINIVEAEKSLQESITREGVLIYES